MGKHETTKTMKTLQYIALALTLAACRQQKPDEAMRQGGATASFRIMLLPPAQVAAHAWDDADIDNIDLPVFDHNGLFAERIAGADSSDSEDIRNFSACMGVSNGSNPVYIVANGRWTHASLPTLDMYERGSSASGHASLVLRDSCNGKEVLPDDNGLRRISVCCIGIEGTGRRFVKDDYRGGNRDFRERHDRGSDSLYVSAPAFFSVSNRLWRVKIMPCPQHIWLYPSVSATSIYSEGLATVWELSFMSGVNFAKADLYIRPNVTVREAAGYGGMSCAKRAVASPARYSINEKHLKKLVNLR
jgi:hypothetical protein